MVPFAERALARLEDVERRAFFEVFDELQAVGGLRLCNRLREDLRGDIVAPRLIVRRIAELADKLLGERNRLRSCQRVVPQALPVARERIDAGGPEGNRLHDA